MKVHKLPYKNILNSNIKYFAKSGRDCFDFIFKTYLCKTKKILMPSYIGQTKKEGSGVFDPVRKNKLLFDFYQLDEKLQIKFKNLEKKVKLGNVQAIFIIHYFGFFQKKMLEISLLCKKHNLILIEDFCHTLFPPKEVNYKSDFKIFSIHKTLNTKNGAYFTSNELFNHKKRTYVNSSNINLKSLNTFINSNLLRIKNIRRNNYLFYYSELRNIKFISIFEPNLCGQEVPLNFPILVKNEFREKLYFYLISQGIESCAMWYELIPEIRRDKYSSSFSISKSILNLSNHQDIGKREILYTVTKIKDFFN